MLKLVDYCDSWKDAFQNEKKELLLALRGQKVLEVEHVGATSVVLCKTCGTNVFHFQNFLPTQSK